MYLAKDHLAGCAAGGLELDAAVHVETIVGQVEGGFKLDTIAETAFAASEAATLPCPWAMVPFIDLSKEGFAATLAAHRDAAGRAARVVGVRMILSFDPDNAKLCWPQVPTGDYLQGKVPAFNDK